MNLLSQEQTDQCNQAMRDIFDTFKRDEPVVFYKASAETAIIESPNYLSRLQKYSNDNITYVPQKREIQARIIYPRKENTFQGTMRNADLQTKAGQELAFVRIQILPEDEEFLIDVENFVLYEETYKRTGSPRKIGILGQVNVISIDLERTN